MTGTLRGARVDDDLGWPKPKPKGGRCERG